MNTIYKSIALEAALLSVTLALQAEIQSEGETVTADVQASTLDRLKVTLVSPNVSGARDLVASGNATIDGNEIAVNLENLAFGTHRLIVSARFGTQIRTLYALDISVPQAELPNETQEYEDEAIVVSTYGDGGGGGEFPTDYAKQGDDPTATLTDAQAYAQAAAAAAQSLIAVDADIFAGKQALATNISAKGVPTAVADALTTMATKVLQIPQQINTGISEFEQMIAPSPYIWNVYTVATDLMKQELPAYIPSYMAGGNYVQYRANNAFFVGEYYLGYDTLELAGADGYLTCDGDFYIITGEVGSRIVTHTAPDGTVETYAAESIIHIWHDGASGYCNRWVGFFYLTNAYSFINNTSNLCPRRVAICGSCSSFVVADANRLIDVWVIGTLGHFEGGTTGNTWGATQVMHNYQEHASGVIYKDGGSKINSIILPDLQMLSGAIMTQSGEGSSVLNTLVLPNLVECTATGYGVKPDTYYKFENIIYVRLDSLEIAQGCIIGVATSGYSSNFLLNRIYAPKLRILKKDSASLGNGIVGAVGRFSEYATFSNLIDFTVGELETNLYFKYWNPTAILSDANKKSELIDNIKNHILDRVSDVTGGVQLTFTVSTNMYNVIASETITWQDQTMTLADAFLTKNWLLAGA